MLKIYKIEDFKNNIEILSLNLFDYPEIYTAFNCFRREQDTSKLAILYDEDDNPLAMCVYHNFNRGLLINQIEVRKENKCLGYGKKLITEIIEEENPYFIEGCISNTNEARNFWKKITGYYNQDIYQDTFYIVL